MAKLTLRDILNISCPQDTAGLCLLINMSFRRICLTLKKPYTLDLQFYQRTVCRAVWVPQYMSQPYEAHVLLIVCLGCVSSKKEAAKMMLLKCCTQYASKFGKLSSGHRTGKGQFSFQSQRKAIPKKGNPK